MAHTINQAFKARRSVYALAKESAVSDDRIREIIEEAVTHAPSAFNSQSGRVVLLLGKNHDELWETTKGILKGVVPDAEAFKATAARIDAFKGAYGTVLFFEDQEVVQGLQKNFALYAENFPIWSQQSSGMLQYAVWTSFAEAGLGANLQHYSPLIDEWVSKKTGVPGTWKLVAQMPFGNPVAPAGEKAFLPVAERVKVIA